jgi:uncharacterized protein YkwD
MTSASLIRILAATTALLASALPSQPAAALNASRAAVGDPSYSLLVSSEQALIDLTNTDRAANGLGALQFDPDTLAIARARAESQLGAQALNHYDANGQLAFAQLLGQANVGYGLAGENLARVASGGGDLTQRVETALMQSPTHRKNILEPTFRRLAIGAATDPATGQITFAEVYRD